MMDEEIRQAVSEVREMKQMCGNINMKLTNIITQRGQDYKKKLEAEYQRGFEDGKWKSEDGCAGCKYESKTGEHLPCEYCMNNFKNQWTAKKEEIGHDIGKWKDIVEGIECAYGTCGTCGTRIPMAYKYYEYCPHCGTKNEVTA